MVSLHSSFLFYFLLEAFPKSSPDDEVYREQSFSFPFECPVYKREEESFSHLFLTCPYGYAIWDFLSVHFGQS